jgi:phosphate:Na+ symporter
VTTAGWFQILGGVGLFLFGIKLMGESLQDLAGDRLRRLIASLTSTPVRGVIVGTLVTVLIQSSSGTTVMTVSFVHAGLMTLKQAVGVIMGANIGTTVTAQLIAFKIKDFALPIVGIGMILAVFGRTKHQRYAGNGMVGFGLLFLGMQNMEAAMSFLRDKKDFFLAFSHHPVLGVLAGTLLTMVVQSSSATVGLTIAMTSQGLLSLDAAIPILLGDNIGTTITAVLASLGSKRAAKQAAAAHVLFNLIGVTIFILFLTPFKHLVLLTSADPSREIANAHTLFNTLNTCLFLPFVSPFVRLVQRLIPGDDSVLDMGPRYLDPKLIDASPAAAVDAVRKELVRMGHLAKEMLMNVRRAFLEDNVQMVQEVYQTEKVVNELNREIARYAAGVWRTLPEDLSMLLSSYVNGVGDVERVGDHAENLIELYEYKIEHGVKFSEMGIQEFQEMIDTALRAFEASLEAIADEDPRLAKAAQALEPEIDAMEKRLRKRHIQRLNEGACSPDAGVVFIDILSNLERIGDHAHNLAFISLDMAKIRQKEAAS